MSGREQFELFNGLLRGRRVVIVGPADTTSGKGQGKLIDSYDLVVRINSQWPVRPGLVPDIGSRADVLYHCCNGDAPIANLRVPEFSQLRFAWYQTNRESEILIALSRERGVPTGCCDAFKKTLVAEMGTDPNTGTVAIAHLLSTGLSELYVTGFSFYATHYYEGYLGAGAKPKNWKWWRRPRKFGKHEFEPQRRHFHGLVKSDRRLKPDAALQKLMRRW